MTQQLVGILIVGFGHGAAIKALLQTLGPRSGLDQAEVVIWDQPRPELGHDSDLPPLAKETAKQWTGTGWSLRLVQSTANLGYGRGLNSAECLLSPRVAWIAVLNPDTEIPPGNLGRWLRASQELALSSDHRLGLTAPTLLNANGRPQRSQYTFPGPWNYWFNHSILGGALKQAWKRMPAIHRSAPMANDRDPNPAKKIDWAMGAAWLVPRLAWHQINGFDPEYFLYAEDTDFCWRLGQANREVWALHDVSVIHHQGEPAGTQRGRQQILLFQGLRLFLRKTQPTLTRWSVLVSMVLDMILRLMLFLGPSALPGSRGQRARVRLWASALTLRQTLSGG